MSANSERAQAAAMVALTLWDWKTEAQPRRGRSWVTSMSHEERKEKRKERKAERKRRKAGRR